MQVEIDALRKRYGAHFALSIPALRIERGEVFGLVGNNGAGKTTLLRLLLDLIEADEGRVLLGGRPAAGQLDWKRHTGAYLDEAFLLDFLTPDEFFVFTGLTYKRTRAEIERALAPYHPFLARGVLDVPDRYIRDLSMGNRKKVGIVAALFTNPDLVVLDEPFANLDPGSQIWLENHLRWINTARGATVVVSSHDLGPLLDVCNRIAVLDEGRIVRDMHPTEDTLEDLHAFFAARLEARSSPPPLPEG